MTKITIHNWDEDDFKSCKEEWNELLARSTSDPLFMSWEWQQTWWNIFAQNEPVSLQLFIARDSNNKLIGIAPLYLSKTRSKKILTTRRLQFIGNYWRGKATMRTELLDFITDELNADKVVKAFYHHLNNLGHWDELVLSDLKKDSTTYRLLISDDLLPKSYYRHAEEYNSFFVNTERSFEDYIKALGRNTRLRLFNRRKLLEKLGEVHFDNNSTDDIETNFAYLNSLHEKRWGTHVFQNKRLKFNVAVARLMAQRDALRFSTLSVNGETVSIQYNYLINNHIYNIQAGFKEALHKKLPLGYLHFGYEIESACNSTINHYDFLAGDGKNTPYKERLTQSSIEIVDLQIIRNPVIKLAYRLYDHFTR